MEDPGDLCRRVGRCDGTSLHRRASGSRLRRNRKRNGALLHHGTSHNRRRRGGEQGSHTIRRHEHGVFSSPIIRSRIVAASRLTTCVGRSAGGGFAAAGGRQGERRRQLYSDSSNRPATSRSMASTASAASSPSATTSMFVPFDAARVITRRMLFASASRPSRLMLILAPKRDASSTSFAAARACSPSLLISPSSCGPQRPTRCPSPVVMPARARRAAVKP